MDSISLDEKLKYSIHRDNLFSLPADERSLTEYVQQTKINLNTLLGFSEQTILHYSVRQTSADHLMNVCAILIEKRLIDVNLQNIHGQTALFKACDNFETDWILFLLLHGADPRVGDENGVLPLTAFVRSGYKDVDRDFIAEIIYDYTFDGDWDKTLDFGNLILCLSSNFKLVVKLFDNLIDPEIVLSSELMWKTRHLENLLHAIAKGLIDSELFAIILKKCPGLIEDFVNEFDVLSAIFKQMYLCKTDDKIKILNILRKNGFTSTLIKNYEPILNPLGEFVMFAYRCRVPLQELSELILDLLSYGYPHRILSASVELICKFYGFCDFFKILICHIMEVYPHHGIYYYNRGSPIMATVSQSLRGSFKILLNRQEDFLSFEQALGYFRSRKLVELCARSADKSVKGKVEAMSKTPSLLELARDATRKFYVRKFNVGSLGEFVVCLRKEGIGLVYERIILYKTRIYHD